MEEIKTNDKCNFVLTNGICGSPINKKQKYCDEIPEKWCYYKQLKRKEKEYEELKERLKCKCFDNNSKQYRCTSYKRMAEDYEKDLARLNNLKQALQEIKEIVSNEVNLQFDITSKLKEIKKIIENEVEE